jgi:hypothetical protein
MHFHHPALKAGMAAAVLLLAAAPSWAERYSPPLWVAQPADDATIHNATGNLRVSVAMGWPLDAAAGDYVQLLLDGKVVADSSDVQHFKLRDVPLGRHRLEAELRDAGDRVLVRSEPVVVDFAPPRG